ncbi:MAG: PLP-dependent aspartate aminotransferase family protein [Calditrichota bacterium]
MPSDHWKHPPKHWHPETKAAHAGFNPFYSMGAVRPPIFTCSTFATENAEKLESMFLRAYGFEPSLQPDEEWPIYTRVSNPNFIMLCDRFEHLELGVDNCRATYFPSGLSAIFCTVLGLCKPGDTLIFGYPVYGGTDHQFRHVLPEKLGLNVIPVNAVNLNEVEDALQKHGSSTKIVFIETPANPSLSMVDIKAVADLTHKYSGGALVVDNTFMSPILQHPFLFDADIIVYSGTKSIGGHSDLIAGFVVDKDLVRAGQINGIRVTTGPTPSAFDAWLLYRSLDTLALRVKRAQENARIVADFLKNHPKVERVVYPDLLTPGSEQRAIYEKQCEGPGAMITFDPIGNKETSYTILNNLGVFSLAVSLGGVESLAENPWFHTHTDVTEEDKRKSGFKPHTIRLSVGIEHPEDLCDDLEQALAKV